MAKQVSKQAKSTQQASKPATSRPTAKRIRPIPFFVTGLLFIAVSVYLSFGPDVTRGWGLNYVRFFAPWVILTYYILLLCFWFPPLNQLIVRFVTQISKANVLVFCAKYKYVWYVIISITFGFAFYLLKTKYIFLGDLDIRAKQIEEGVILNDEYFTMLFFKHIYTYLHVKFEYTGLQTIRLFDYITGSLFIFLSLCIANLLGNSFLKKCAVFLVGTLSCTIILQFCGYTEIYAFPVLSLICYLFACILHLKGKAGIYLPFIVLVMGIGFHLLLVCMFPSFIFLFYRSVLWKYPLFRKRNTIIVLLLVAAPFIYFGVSKYAFPKMMSLSTDDSSLMTLFSINHWKEFANSQLLASGIGFLLWLVTLLHSLINRIKYDVIQWFLFISSLFIVILMFVFDPHRGAGDWDILAFAAIVYNLSNAYYLISLHDKKIFNNIKYGILMISGFSVLHTSCWLATNNTDASIGWIEAAIETDPARYYKTSFNSEAMLAAMFEANKLHDISLKWYQMAYHKYANDPRMGFNLASSLITRNLKSEAIPIYEDLVNRFPNYPIPYPHLASLYLENKDYESLYNMLKKMETAYNNNKELFDSRLQKESIDQLFSILHQLREQL